MSDKLIGKPGFPPTNYVVNIVVQKQCQSVINDDKKTKHEVCKDLIYYECAYYFVNRNRMKLFKKLKPANEYCESLRNKIAGPSIPK